MCWRICRERISRLGILQSAFLKWAGASQAFVAIVLGKLLLCWSLCPLTDVRVLAKRLCALIAKWKPPSSISVLGGFLYFRQPDEEILNVVGRVLVVRVPIPLVPRRLFSMEDCVSRMQRISKTPRDDKIIRDLPPRTILPFAFWLVKVGRGYPSFRTKFPPTCASS